MFGVGHLWELVVVLIIALVIFGPKRLPEIGGAMGKGIREFKRGTQEAGEEPADRTQSQLTSGTPEDATTTSTTRERDTA